MYVRLETKSNGHEAKHTLTWASIHLDAPLLGHDAILITHAPSFLKKLLISTRFSSYCSYLLVCHLRAHDSWPSEVHRSGAGLARHDAMLPSPSRVTVASSPLVRPMPLFATSGHCRWLAAHKRR